MMPSLMAAVVASFKQFVAPPDAGLEDYVTVDGFTYITRLGNIFSDNALATPITVDGTSIGSMDDIAGDTYDATNSVTLEPVWNESDESASFTNDLFTTGHAMDATTGTLFARFRVNLASAGTDTLLGSASGANRCWLSCTNGVLSAGIGGTGSDGFQGGGDIRSATDWHTAAIVYDASNIVLYLDGVEVNTTAKTGTVSPNSISLGARYVGGSSYDNYFNGDISHWLSDDRAITASEILEMHNLASGITAPAGGHRYWRLKGTKAGSFTGGALGEIEFYDTVGGSSIATGGTAAAGSEAFGGTAEQAFDGDKGGLSFWAGDSGAVDAGTSWLSYDFGSDVDIKEFEITARSSGNSNQVWDEWNLEYSDDNIVWEVIQDFIDNSSWTSSESRKFEVTLPLPSIAFGVSGITKAYQDNGTVGLSIPYALNAQVGDLWVALLFDDDTTTGGGSNYSVPSGFTQREFLDSSDTTITIMTAPALGTETGDLSFTHVDSRAKIGFLLLLSGVDLTGNPIKLSGTLAAVTSTSITTAEVTTASEAVVLSFASFDGGDIVEWGVSGTGWDMLASESSATGSVGVGCAVSAKIVSSTNSVDATFTTGKSDGLQGKQIAFYEA